MAKLHLKGYIGFDNYSIIALSDNKPTKENYLDKGSFKSIITSIEEFANMHGLFGEHHEGLGGRKAIIDNCNMRVYFTNQKCELDEAMQALDNMLYGGDIKTKVSWEGYSEYTITGLSLEHFSIGGHNLSYEFNTHLGKYCHIIIEC